MSTNYGYVTISLKKTDGGRTRTWGTWIAPLQEPTTEAAVATLKEVAETAGEQLRTEWRGAEVLEWFLGHGFDETAPQFDYLKASP